MTSRIICCRNSIRKTSSALLLLGAIGLSSVAMADTMTQSLSFRLNPDSTAEVLHFQPFDLSLGTLESVGISFDATRRHDLAIWNFSGQPAAVDYDASLTDTFLTLGGNNFSFADLLYGPGTTGMLSSVTLPGFLTESQAGRADFMAGLDPVYPSAFNPDSTMTALTGFYSPLGFFGDLNLAYNPGFFSFSASNAIAASLVDVAGTATVTYTFKAVSVPDSAVGLWVPAIWVGLLLAARARRTEIKPAI